MKTRDDKNRGGNITVGKPYDPLGEGQPPEDKATREGCTGIFTGGTGVSKGKMTRKTMSDNLRQGKGVIVGGLIKARGPKAVGWQDYLRSSSEYVLSNRGGEESKNHTEQTIRSKGIGLLGGAREWGVTSTTEEKKLQTGSHENKKF